MKLGFVDFGLQNVSIVQESYSKVIVWRKETFLLCEESVDIYYLFYFFPINFPFI